MSSSIWLLPQGVNEILPNEAAKLEALRRTILDELQDRDFDLVFPPMIEFLDNLIQGAGSELTTQTFKVPDYDSHKTLGIRADMTPQIAQIDAHRLTSEINKLCYIGTVLRTKPMTLGGSRELLQIGAELFGDESIEADKCILDAMLAVHSLSFKSQLQLTLSLSHVDIFSALIETLEINEQQSALIYDALLRKSTPDINALNASANEDLSAFIALSKARGDSSVIEQFRQEQAIAKLMTKNTTVSNRIDTALAELEALAMHIQQNNDDQQNVNLHIDLSELHGYQYHTGLTFQTFIKGEGRAIAKGGRYHGFSHSQEKPRAAIGFSADLKLLASIAA